MNLIIFSWYSKFIMRILFFINQQLSKDPSYIKVSLALATISPNSHIRIITQGSIRICRSPQDCGSNLKMSIHSNLFCVSTPYCHPTELKKAIHIFLLTYTYRTQSKFITATHNKVLCYINLRNFVPVQPSIRIY